MENSLFWIVAAMAALVAAAAARQDFRDCEVIWPLPVGHAALCIGWGAFYAPPGMEHMLMSAALFAVVGLGVRMWFHWRLGFEALGLADVFALAAIGGSLGAVIGAGVMLIACVAAAAAIGAGGFGGRAGAKVGVATDRTVLPLLPFLLGVWALAFAAGIWGIAHEATFPGSGFGGVWSLAASVAG